MRNLLFYGELPPESQHGIANANLINLKMLGSVFVIDIVQEGSFLTKHDKISFNKFLNFIKCIWMIIFKTISHRYDYFYLVFSLTTFGSLKTLLAILNFRLFNRGKVVLHIHRGDFFSRFHKVDINKFMAKHIFGLSHKIIVLSESQKAEFDSTFNRQCNVLFNTVEIEYKHVIKKSTRINFLYISNYLIEKGILDLLIVFAKMIQKYRNISLSTYGSFSDNQIKEKILAYSSANIHINGSITGIKKFRIIAQADCLILPSWNEGQPIILLEAMSTSTPVIATQVGLITELLGADYPFLALPGDKESLEKKIIQFLNLESSTDLSDRLKSRYYDHYSQKRHKESLYKIFC